MLWVVSRIAPIKKTMRYSHLAPAATERHIRVLDAGAAPILPHFHGMAADSGGADGVYDGPDSGGAAAAWFLLVG
jgi:hypothetical protein